MHPCPQPLLLVLGPPPQRRKAPQASEVEVDPPDEPPTEPLPQSQGFAAWQQWNSPARKTGIALRSSKERTLLAASLRERFLGCGMDEEDIEALCQWADPDNTTELLADVDHWAGRLTPGSYSSDDLLFWLVAKLPRELWDECRSTAECKARALHYEDLCVLLLELALEKESDQHLNNYCPGGGGSGSQGKGYQGSRPGQGTTPKHACIMENVKELFWCDARDEQGHLQHAPDCEQRDCFVVQGKKQETNTGAKAKMPDHYRCTITCAFCGKRKHYEDECYHKHGGHPHPPDGLRENHALGGGWAAVRVRLSGGHRRPRFGTGVQCGFGPQGAPLSACLPPCLFVLALRERAQQPLGRIQPPVVTLQPPSATTPQTSGNTRI